MEAGSVLGLPPLRASFLDHVPRSTQTSRASGTDRPPEKTLNKGESRTGTIS
jgi:hypothetical protein